MHNGVPQLAVKPILQEVLQPVLAPKLLAVEVEREACVEVGVVPQQLLHVLGPEPVRLENVGVGLEANARAVAFGGRFHLGVVRELAQDEACALHLALPHTLHHEFCAQCVDRLGAHTIQSDRLLERAAVVLAAGVDFGHAVDHLPQRNATAVVAHTHFVVLDRHLDGPSVPHGVLVDAVVDHLLQEHVDAVVGVLAVSQFPDVHPRAHPDVLLPIEAPNVVFRVLDLLCHICL